MLRPSTGSPQVLDSLPIDWEITGRRTIFGRHVGDDGAVAAGERRHPWPEEFDKLSRDLVAAQEVRDLQGKICREHAGAESSGQAYADDVRQPYRDRETEEDAFRLQPANAPSENSDALIIGYDCRCQ